MEKFLKVCWTHDPFSGEANYNIDNNFDEGTLFFDPENNVKKNIVSNDIKQLILSGKISDNTTGMKYAINKGCEPKLFTEIVKKLEMEKQIECYGDVNYKSSDIHKVKVYYIKRKYNGT